MFNRYRYLFLLLCCAFQLSANDTYHLASGTNYGKEGAAAYTIDRHGPDGAYLLDPYFTPYLENLENKTVLDAGCGSAPWVIYAAERGGKVFGIDIQEGMIELGRVAVEKANLQSKVDLAVGDVASLPYSPDSFDVVISINVGCNLPSTSVVDGKPSGLGPHLKEMRRVLKEGGLAILSAPISPFCVFTDGTDHETVLKRISAILEQLPDNPEPSVITSQLNLLTEVYKANFTLAEGRLILVTDESQLQIGQEIWRKLSGLTVPNHFHPESEYLKEIADAGFAIKECHRPCFKNREELAAHNSSVPAHMQLGDEYIGNPISAIFCLE